MDFSKFDKAINMDTLNKQIEDAKQNSGNDREVPAGKYIAKLEKMEVGATSDGRPMFKVQLRITEGEFKKWCLFMNKVLYGTKNDGNMINSVMGWLNNLEPETSVEFKNYSQFSEMVLDIYEELADLVELEVEYDPKAFNSIKITDVYETDGIPF